MRQFQILIVLSWLAVVWGADEQSSRLLRGRISSSTLFAGTAAEQELQTHELRNPIKESTRLLADETLDSLVKSAREGETNAVEESAAATESSGTTETTARAQESAEADDNLPNKKDKNQQKNDDNATKQPAKDASTTKNDEDDLASIKEELQEEERMVREVGGYGAVLAMIAMIFTAWQMNDNPDGIFATMCRLVITICGLFIGLLLTPCRRCIGPSRASSHTYGHVPVAPTNLEFGFTS
ncbi:hypothetical protein MPSEU_000237400 [Mayamaea pseudoterrestris]|nr:hypothetical protein MPSEU_000237400 [Mayamaea pseudoterrestris]